VDVHPTTLSSAQTFLMKFIFPTVWISGFGAGTLAMWLSAAKFTGAGTPPDDPRLGFLVAWIVGTLVILFVCAGLKRVRVDDKSMFVSNYVRELAIPLSEIVDVTEVRWINIHPVRVHFGHRTRFGNTIVFMPKARWFGLWSSHPVVAKLKELSRAQSGQR
jgi:hypothetical protein